MNFPDYAQIRRRFTQHLAQTIHTAAQKAAHGAGKGEQIHAPAGPQAAEHKAPQTPVPPGERKDKKYRQRRQAERRVKRRRDGRAARRPAQHAAEVVHKAQRRPGQERIRRLQRLGRDRQLHLSRKAGSRSRRRPQARKSSDRLPCPRRRALPYPGSACRRAAPCP